MDNGVEAENDSRRAILTAQCVAYIRETGDGEFATRLWDVLQGIPEVEAQLLKEFELLSAELDAYTLTAEFAEKRDRCVHGVRASLEVDYAA